ncbi:DUF4442 domain-containing protein [Streptomyces sp. NBC_01334]|uniref:DUF4442 domain-containing protein n=1 Tax=Streptomyces sp. NBC_01334 TaxID=2903827 RepID=UPI002E100E0C|nr:DUF4442 domain-containing protein [Streptomyces sp. NBC_01334]
MNTDGSDIGAVRLEAVRAMLSQAMPFTRTIGLQYVDIARDRAVLRLPDRADLHNHVAGPHGGVAFTLADSAAGALTLAGFSDLLDRYTPFLAQATIRYCAVAMGDLTAEARTVQDNGVVRRNLEARGKARFDVEVQIRDSSGALTVEMTANVALTGKETRP